MTSDPGLVVAQLEVDRSELAEGLRQLVRITGAAPSGDAILAFKDGRLHVRIGGGEILAAATGSWLGEARVSASIIPALAKGLPKVDPLAFRVEGNRVHIAGLKLPCHWQAAGAAVAEIPIGALLPDILRIGMVQTDAALEHSGILKRVQEARGRREELVQKAAAVLRPLEVRPEDINQLVESRLRVRLEGSFEETE